MDVQPRYATKSDCFARAYERALKIDGERFLEYVRDELAQFTSQPKDRSEWEYVIRARIWDHVVCFLRYFLDF
jgi:hypothetical protein